MKRFFDFVEIRTKITSLFPALMTAALLFVQRQPIRYFATGVFFLSMFTFDLTTTAINNYIDSRTNGQNLPHKRSTALAILLTLLGLGVAGGLYLVYLTDIVVLLTGALCFVCGILYTYGPVPISRTPFGEVLSGLFYGFFIPFLILYINEPAGSLMALSLDGGMIRLSINIMAMIRLALFSAIPAFTTANIMLANNICDVQKDIAVVRHTLPYYIGNKALILFEGLYYLCYLDVIAMVLLHVIPPICLAILLTIKIVRDNIKAFKLEQEKSTTFAASIRNYVVINGAMTVLIFAGRFIG